jgi:uridine kinase
MDDLIKAILDANTEHKQPFIIAISGFGGSGKSVLAKKLQASLGNTEVIAIDDFYGGPDGKETYVNLLSQVLLPGRKGDPIKYQEQDWATRQPAKWREIRNMSYLILDGNTLLRPDVSPYYDFKVWIDCPLEVATARGMKRDREEQGVDHDEMWLGEWAPTDKRFFELYHPDKAADFILPYQSA